MAWSWGDWADHKGYRWAWGDRAVVEDVRAEIEARRAGGGFDEAFYQDNLAPFRYLADIGPARAKAVVLLAVPRPAHRLLFARPQGEIVGIVPPTYLWYRGVGEELRAELAGLLGESHYLTLLQAPLKAVATRLGLAAYGRNNLAYVPGFGSYHQLVGFVTDAPPDSCPAASREPEMSPACRDCRICRDACPTRAIGEDRFLLRAERCLTLQNEEPGPWPEWLPPITHHCLVGCLACQQACPQNRGLLRYETIGESFAPDETELILAGPAAETDPRWDGLKAKLAALGLPAYGPVLGRNLRALAAAGSR